MECIVQDIKKRKNIVTLSNQSSSAFCQSWRFISSQQRSTRKTQSTPCLTVEKVLELIKVPLLFPHCIVMNQCWPLLKFVSNSSHRRQHWKRHRRKWRSSCPVLTVKICSSLWGALHRLLCPGALQIHPFTPQTSWSSWCAPSFSVTGKHCHGISVWMWTNDTLPVQTKATLFFTNATNWVVYSYYNGTSSLSIIFMTSTVCVQTLYFWLWRERTTFCASSVSSFSPTCLKPWHVLV